MKSLFLFSMLFLMVSGISLEFPKQFLVNGDTLSNRKTVLSCDSSSECPNGEICLLIGYCDFHGSCFGGCIYKERACLDENEELINFGNMNACGCKLGYVRNADGKCASTPFILID